MLFRVAVAVQAPLHRKWFDLGDNFHFVDTAVARYATHTRSDVGRVIEVNKVGQVVNSLPTNRFTITLAKVGRFQAVTNRFQQCAFAMNNTQGGTLFGPIATVAVSTSRSRWNGRMTCLLNRVVTVATVQFELASMELVAKWNGLLWFVPHIDDRRMDRSKQTRCQISTYQQCSANQTENKLVDPVREKKVLH